MPEVSIVIPAYNEGVRLAQTLAALRETVSLSYEVIVVNDASTDSSCHSLAAPENIFIIHLPQHQGVAHARNLGAEHAKAPILITLDGHCTPQAGWLEKMLQQLHQPGAGIVAPQIRSQEDASATTFGLTVRDQELGVGWMHQTAKQPYPVPLAGCACLVMMREFFHSIGGFQEFRSYGMEDVELCIRCWLFGYSVMMVPDAVVEHWFKKDAFPVGWHDFLYNRLRTALLHFDGARLHRILTSLQAKPAFSEAVTSLLLSDVWTEHARMRQRRQHDGDWFCQRFELAL